jgi:hypothetical protein
MKAIQKMTQSEVGAFVQSHLRENGITVILSGGALVSIYSKNKYISKDLDMVNVNDIKRSQIRKILQEKGFFEEGRYFKHKDSPFIIEFPPGPLSVGGEPVKEIIEIKYSTGILKVISPTDCVKDRLAAYYYWGDLQSLAQAILVASAHEVNFKEIERWSKTGGKLDEFNKIKNKFEIQK